MEKSSALKRPSLAEVLSYENKLVINCFLRSFAVSDGDATELFMDMKRMLWLCNEMNYDGLRKEKKQFSIDQSLLVLDEMWHTFILCTADYRKFCFDYFGHFIDHLPTAEDAEEKISRKTELQNLPKNQAIAKVMDEKRWQYTYVLEKLGRDIFLKWYTEYHQKYTVQYLLDLKSKKLALQADVIAQAT